MQPVSVSEFVGAVSSYLEQGMGSVAVQGEVVDFRVNRDRLVFFELKDARSRVLCFSLAWEMDAALEDGMEVVVTGIPKLFQKSGQFHIRVQRVDFKGEGALRRAFELTKRKLAAEGLFDERHKKPLPRFPERIGLITSHEAAAYTDVLQILQSRWGGLEIYVASVAVQGAGAAAQIIRALSYFNRFLPVDVLIVTRGGGSLEDLQAFNSERVARAVFASNIPVVVGVGHERDETLAEYAADVRASTPTHAAELVVPHRDSVRKILGAHHASLLRSCDMQMSRIKHKLSLASHVLLRYGSDIEAKFKGVYARLVREADVFANALSRRRRDIAQCAGSMEQSLLQAVKEWEQAVAGKEDLLRSLHPYQVMRRGYSVTWHKGKVVRSIADVERGDSVKTFLSDGVFYSDVQRKKKDKKSEMRADKG